MALALVATSLCVTSCTMVTPIAATSNEVGNKCGTSSSATFLGFLGGSANMGINSAVKKAGITKISHIDLKRFNFIGLYEKRTVMVYGE